MTVLMPDSLTDVAQKLFAQRASELQVQWYSFDGQMTLVDASGSSNAFSLCTAPVAVAHAAIEVRSKRVLHRSTVDGRDLLAFPYPGGVVVVDLTEGIWPFDFRDRLAIVLKNYYEDLNCIAEDQQAIQGFNASLSQSYEEVNLIFRMAQLLTSGNDPAAVVQGMGDELREVLHYGWVAIVLDDSQAVLAPLRGSTTFSGQILFDKRDFSAAVVDARVAASSKVLVPGESSLADLARSEVLIEKIMQDGVVVGTLVAGNRLGEDVDVSSNEIQLVTAAAGYLGLFHQNAFRFADQRQQFLGTLKALSAAVDAKDPYTQGHSQRVALLASQTAAKLGFDDQTIETFRVAGLLHDIGKIGVPEAILCKPAKLTDEEFQLIKRHPEIGYRILKDLPSLQSHIQGVLHHHERWDGSGYPQGLAGNQIPMLARVLALADTFDAMSSNRSYRPRMHRPRILEEIRSSAGTQFDPHLVEIFLGIDFTKFDALFNAYANGAPAHSPPLATGQANGLP